MELKIVIQLIVIISLATGTLCATGDKTITLTYCRSTKIQSPNWPSDYDNGSYGRYIIKSPANSQITAKCDINMFDPSPNASCALERFYVNVHGTSDYSTAEVLCGVQKFTRISDGNQLMIAYVSVRYSGKFSCELIAKPISN